MRSTPASHSQGRPVRRPDARPGPRRAPAQRQRRARSRSPPTPASASTSPRARCRSGRATSCSSATASFRPTSIRGCSSLIAECSWSSFRSPREGWPDEARLLERLADPRVQVPRRVARAVQQRLQGRPRRALEGDARHQAPGSSSMPSRAWASCPVDLAETPVDILATGAQKWLLSPWGSGFFYVRKEILEQLTPPVRRLARLSGHRRLQQAHGLQPRRGTMIRAASS